MIAARIVPAAVGLLFFAIAIVAVLVTVETATGLHAFLSTL